MKIGYLVPEFPGQTHIFFWREIKILEKMNVEIDVISTKHPPLNIMSHTWTEEALERTTYLFPPTRYLFGIFIELLRCGVRSWWQCLQAILKSKKKSLSEKVNLFTLIFIGAEISYLARVRGWQHLHVHSCANSANIAMFAKLISHLPYSITLHGPLQDYGSNQEQKWYFAKFAIVITKKLAQEVNQNLQGYLPEKVEIAPMGVDTSVFMRRIPYVSWHEHETCYIFSCGRLNFCKGHADLIKVISLLKQEGIKIKLEIAGEDEQGGKGYRKELAKIIKQLGLNDSVHLLGAVSEDLIRASLEKAHIFVLASLSEPLGVAIMEAMAMEVPVVVTGAGGVKELVDDQINGILVEPQNPSLLASTILSLLRDKQLSISLGKAAREKVVKYFSSQVSAKVLLDSIKH